jgi:hypothetical protein
MFHDMFHVVPDMFVSRYGMFHGMFATICLFHDMFHVAMFMFVSMLRMQKMFPISKRKWVLSMFHSKAVFERPVEN